MLDVIAADAMEYVHHDFANRRDILYSVLMDRILPRACYSSVFLSRLRRPVDS